MKMQYVKRTILWCLAISITVLVVAHIYPDAPVRTPWVVALRTVTTITLLTVSGLLIHRPDLLTRRPQGPKAPAQQVPPKTAVVQTREPAAPAPAVRTSSSQTPARTAQPPLVDTPTEENKTVKTTKEEHKEAKSGTNKRIPDPADAPKLIAHTGFGYGWGELYYSPAADQFYEKNYSCGAVDICDTHYDGRKDLTREEALRILVREGRLWDVRCYQKELHLDEILDDVLASWESRPELSNYDLAMRYGKALRRILSDHEE